MLEFSIKKMRLANYLLIVLLLVSTLLLARNIVNIFFSEKAPLPSMNNLLNTKGPNKVNIMHYASILEKNPFGPPLKFHSLVVSHDTEQRFSSLTGLTLVGTVTGPRHLSYAVFEDTSQSSSGKQEVFRYGERVFNYGILKKITSSYAEIEQNSEIYKVSIPFGNLDAGPKETQSKKNNIPKTAFSKKVGERKYLLNSRLVQQSIDNPEHMLTDARLLPNFKDGKQVGFSISEVIPDGLYHNLGLRNGDILLKINDLKISNPEVAIQAMSALKGMNRINLDIIRNGENMSMNYQIR